MGLGRWYWRHNSFWSDADRRRYRARQAQKRREVGARQKAQRQAALRHQVDTEIRAHLAATGRAGLTAQEVRDIELQLRASTMSNAEISERMAAVRFWRGTGAVQRQASSVTSPSHPSPATLMATPHSTPIATAAGRGKPLWVKVCAISVGVVFILIGVIGAIVQGSQPAPLVPSVVQESLDVATQQLDATDISYQYAELGGASAPVVLSNWLVCSVSPPVGSRASHVTLTVVDTAGWAGGPTTC